MQVFLLWQVFSAFNAKAIFMVAFKFLLNETRRYALEGYYRRYACPFSPFLLPRRRQFAGFR
jgi:hypothetical protein